MTIAVCIKSNHLISTGVVAQFGAVVEYAARADRERTVHSCAASLGAIHLHGIVAPSGLLRNVLGGRDTDICLGIRIGIVVHLVFVIDLPNHMTVDRPQQEKSFVDVHVLHPVFGDDFEDGGAVEAPVVLQDALDERGQQTTNMPLLLDAIVVRAKEIHFLVCEELGGALMGEELHLEMKRQKLLQILGRESVVVLRDVGDFRDLLS